MAKKLFHQSNFASLSSAPLYRQLLLTRGLLATITYHKLVVKEEKKMMQRIEENCLVTHHKNFIRKHTKLPTDGSKNYAVILHEKMPRAAFNAMYIVYIHILSEREIKSDIEQIWVEESNWTGFIVRSLCFEFNTRASISRAAIHYSKKEKERHATKKKRKRTMYLNCNGCGKQKNSFKCYTLLWRKTTCLHPFCWLLCLYIFAQCITTKTSELIPCIQSLVFGLCTAIFLVFFLVASLHFCLHLHHRYYIHVKVCCHYQCIWSWKFLPDQHYYLFV